MEKERVQVYIESDLLMELDVYLARKKREIKGYSRTEFINEAIKEKMEKEGKK